AHMGSWSLRPDGTFDYWSPETFVLLGFDPSEGITDNSRALLVCLCKKSSAPTRNIGDGGTSCQSLSAETERDLFSGAWLAGSVGKRQIFHRRLATNGLRIELHQAQDIFRHIIPDRQTQFLSAFAGNREIVCPGAAGEELGQLYRLLRSELAPEQIGHLVLHLKQR